MNSLDGLDRLDSPSGVHQARRPARAGSAVGAGPGVEMLRLRPLAIALAGVHEADDLLQAAAVRIVRDHPDLADHAGFVRRVLTRLWLDRRRSMVREAARLARFALTRPQPASPGLARSAEAGERDRAVQRAVGALPPKQRAAVVLRLIEGMTHAQIAEAMGCSVESARRSLHEGRARLRSLLEPEFGPDGGGHDRGVGRGGGGER